MCCILDIPCDVLPLDVVSDRSVSLPVLVHVLLVSDESDPLFSVPVEYAESLSEVLLECESSPLSLPLEEYCLMARVFSFTELRGRGRGYKNVLIP